MDQDDSWYTLTPGIVHEDRPPAVFGPKDVSPVAVCCFPGSQDAGMYTISELSSFWDSILISAASRNALKSSPRHSLSFETTTRTQTVFHILLLEQDNMISPGYLKDRSMVHLDQLHMFLNTVESASPCFYFSNSL